MSEKINHGSTVTGKARVSILNDSIDPVRKWIKKRCVSIQFGGMFRPQQFDFMFLGQS